MNIPVEKYNHVHDGAGRFGSSTSYSLSINTTAPTPKAQAMVDSTSQAAFAAIAKVHTSSKLKNVTVQTRTAQQMKAGHVPSNVEGWYSQDQLSVLNINENAHGPTGTVVHEFGHMLDHEEFGNPAKLGSQSMASMTDPKFGAISDAIMKSDTFYAISSQSVMRDIQNANGLPDNSGMQAYLRNPPEIFARAYSQWIAQKSGDPALLAELHASQNDNPFEQWTTHDFKPISKAFDKYFGDKGLLVSKPFKVDRKGVVTKYNMAHDGAGRFAPGGGSNAGTSPKSREVQARMGVTKAEVGSAYDGDWQKTATYTSKSGKSYVLTHGTRPGDRPGYTTVKVMAHPDSTENSRISQMIVDNGKDAGVIGIVQVHPDHRRQGLATAMLEFARRESSIPVNHDTPELRSPDGEQFASVVKYNTAHDGAGRFATTDGGAAFSVDTSGYTGTDRQPHPLLVSDVTAAAAATESAIHSATGFVVPAKVKYVSGDRMATLLGGAKSTIGFYRPSERGTITMANVPLTHFFLAHEYGHLLDFEHFGKGRFASGNAKTGKVSGVMSAIMGSAKYGQWRKEANSGYWASNNEVFARGFAQYVAQKSGNADMLTALRSQAGAQWSTAEFAPISSAFDALFHKA
jgi:hypothetical protein